MGLQIRQVYFCAKLNKNKILFRPVDRAISSEQLKKEGKNRISNKGDLAKRSYQPPRLRALFHVCGLPHEDCGLRAAVFLSNLGKYT